MPKPKPIYAALFLVLFAAPSWSTPSVLATLKPVHSLVAGVMQGVGEPQLLIGGALSEHSYELKPSDARKLQSADVVIEIGPDMETYLIGPIRTLGGGSTVVVLERAPGVRLYPARHGGLWGEGDGHDHGPNDPHIWLDPRNAVAMTRAIAAALVKRDPAHAALYRANETRQIALLEALDRELAAKLAPVRDRPYIVFHDAYRYFEERYGLHSAGAVTVAPERPVGTRRVATLREAVANGRAVCLFREPQFPPKLIEALDEGTKARVGVLDPLGADLAPGPGLYPRLLRDLAQSLTGCLGKKN
jgi:zinc transport system substrate-binding protein